MRTRQRDSGLVVFSFEVVDAANGQGTMFADARYSFIQVSTGVYSVRFDPRIVPMSTAVHTTFAVNRYVLLGSAIPGFLDVRAYSDLGVTPTNSSFRVIMTALDKRQ